MAKTIIFCADGTWNGPQDASGESVLDTPDVSIELSETAVTNVVKLYANIAGVSTAESVALADENEKLIRDGAGNTTQAAKYLIGVGDSTNPIVKIMGGIFGMGVVARIVRGFTFISRHYEAGDAIHICGFSRGAYTARALGGLIAQVGLLDPATYDPTDQAKAYRLGVAAWAKSKRIQLNLHGGLDLVANAIISAIEGVIAAPLTDQNLRAPVPIKSIFVWDTVGSMGIPEYVKGARVDLFRFVDTALSSTVQSGFHAMALDEQRADFPVTKWDPREGITQVWFTGAHADVGGGYPPTESRLSDVALDWMTANLGQQGVALVNPASYTPDMKNAVQQAIHTPWTNPPFDHLGRASRVVAATDQIHPSVKARWLADPTYRPAALQGISFTAS
jgi:uncharacterized protein (DUF2235 family)